MTRRQWLALMLASPRAPFSGTFLQLTRGHRQWPESRWRELWGYLGALGAGRLIVQWTQDGDEPLDDLLPQVFASGLAIDLGLVHEPRYWTDGAAAFPAIEARTRALLPRLRPWTARPNFKGWYITTEVDDVRWQAPAARAELVRHLKATVKAVRRVRRAPVAVSGFANGALKPEALAEFWRRLLRETGGQQLLFQDGIGAGKLTLDNLPAYYQALRRVPHLAVVEIFEMVREVPFEATAAPLSRVLRQLALAGGAPLAFSLPEYATPAGVPSAGTLYQGLISGSRAVPPLE
ncbi:MAG: DUF4434 domain-containing protein [Acidobacteria bacterium]|nr:DUF4434 domain-containing protein [Acidobacteriota bacterium]